MKVAPVSICNAGEGCGDEGRRRGAKSSGVQGRCDVQAAAPGECRRQRPNEPGQVVQRTEGRAGVFLHRAKQVRRRYV